MTPAPAALDARAFALEFAADVARDLRKSPKELQSRYLYDDLGSSLFEAICRLPWYRITQSERQLLLRHTPQIVSVLREPTTLVELGCGSGEKISIVIDAIAGAGQTASLHLIDISEEALRQSARAVGSSAHVSVVGHRSTYEEGLRHAAAAREPDGTMLVLLLGSNIGNFDEPAAGEFLATIRKCLRAGDAFLLGADLVKSEAELLLAYDDPLGVTAAFNKNLLARINNELGGTFDLTAFDHRAVWNSDARRVEMHLASRRAQEVSIAAAHLTVPFATGETIWTESSYKYEPDEIVERGGRAGFGLLRQWIDPTARFALTLFAAAEGGGI
jgi:dimethylhistidine N-methyltransferase